MNRKDSVIRRIWGVIAGSHILTSAVALIFAILLSSVIILLAVTTREVYATMLPSVSRAILVATLRHAMPLNFAVCPCDCKPGGRLQHRYRGRARLGAFPPPSWARMCAGCPASCSCCSFCRRHRVFRPLGPGGRRIAQQASHQRGHSHHHAQLYCAVSRGISGQLSV